MITLSDLARFLDEVGDAAGTPPTRIEMAYETPTEMWGLGPDLPRRFSYRGSKYGAIPVILKKDCPPNMIYIFTDKTKVRIIDEEVP